MQKINFCDKIALTEAVLNGNKTMTRRVMTDKELKAYPLNGTPYQVNEVLAVAQSYKKALGSKAGDLANHQGYNNKLFVSADLMPHHIRITAVRLERLQDISATDCFAEGVKRLPNNQGYTIYSMDKKFDTPQQAFREMLKISSGKDVWNSNPIMAVYTFAKVN